MKCKKYYKDMDKFRAYKKRCKERYRLRTGSGKFKPRAWSQDEINMLLNRDYSDRKLSEILKRSLGAIQTKRSRIIGKLKGESKKWVI